MRIRNCTSRIRLATSLIVSVIVLGVAPAIAQRASTVRTTSSFDREWRFLKGDAPGAEKNEFNDGDWRRLDVPHDWSIEGPVDEKHPTGQGGGFMPSGVGWYRKSWWSEKPMVYIARRVARTPLAPTDPGYNPIDERRPQVLFSDWTPKNLQPHKENVEVYSNCEEVELFLNGKSLGRQPLPRDDSPRVWKVSFAPGNIKAMGLNKGKVAASYVLPTAGKPARILLTANKNSVVYDWNDVVFVNVSIVDENGVLVPNAENSIDFKIEGAGFVAAVDSANSNSHEPYQATQRKAYQGKCLALIKATVASGKIKLTATSANLQSASVELNVARASRPRT
jgi:Glycoside hydrolase family 2 C-terminal domain 5/Domain of unknown function (DUF4982)